MDRVVVTACSRETQLQRLVFKRAVSKRIAEQIIRAQVSQETKIARADHVLWNDSTLQVLEDQTRALTAYLSEFHG
jgi:dephospho-CoA kinase